MSTRDRDKIKKSNPQMMIKAETIIKDVMQQFRYPLLENYEANLL